MKYIFLLLLFLLCPYSIRAQNLLGSIVDDSGIPIADANIYTPSGKHITHSNEMGKFILTDLKAGDTLILSFLGYEQIEKILKENDFEQEVSFILKEAQIDLTQIYVSNALKAINKVANIDLLTRPVNSSQEILRRVPGLIIGQHAGGGKAEQIFLRGFDIDHGTDIDIQVDGMPVNMVSHAHGQGYADLHFLIPETIERIDFGKGPYYTNHGNFTTAGYVDFKTKDKLENSTVGLEFGQFNTFRAYGLFDLLKNTDKQHAYLASEYLLTDGPVISPQNFNRLNIMGKYTSDFKNNDQLSFLVSHFQSKWDASGQIPQRLVDRGIISRFGSVDDTEGGNTSRTNLALEHTKSIRPNTFLKSRAYYSRYNFELFSNFTFFLEDPINGDQIRQFENRNLYGFNTTLFHSRNTGVADLEFSYGIGLRYDDVNDNQLAHTKNRQTILEQLSFGDIGETNYYGFINTEIDFGKWLMNPGIRFDLFNFTYDNRLTSPSTLLSASKTIFTPNLNLIFNPNNRWQLFFKSGIGFHSNDSRVVVTEKKNKTLPAAYGADLGAVWKPFSRLWLNASLWYLFLEQEFVYVGDAAIVEPSGKTTRKGLDLSIRHQLTNFLFFDADFNYTHARSVEEEKGFNRIPLSPELTSAGGFSFRFKNGLHSSVRYRYIKDRPANENNSIIAKGYFITDANASYSFNGMTLSISIENIFNQEWNEAQFATESQLQDEPEPVEELHFTPGIPFFIKGSLKYHF